MQARAERQFRERVYALYTVITFTKKNSLNVRGYRRRTKKNEEVSEGFMA